MVGEEPHRLCQLPQTHGVGRTRGMCGGVVEESRAVRIEHTLEAHALERGGPACMV